MSECTYVLDFNFDIKCNNIYSKYTLQSVSIAMLLRYKTFDIRGITMQFMTSNVKGM